MKTVVKILVFIVAAIFIIIAFATLKQSLHDQGKPAAVNWIGSTVILILFYIMFNTFGNSKNKSNDKNDEIQLKK